MRRSGIGGEKDDEERITDDESTCSISEGDSSREAVGWVRLEELSSAKISSGNKEILRLVKRGVGVLSTQKWEMVENILCSQNVTWREIWRCLERGSQQW